MGRIIAGVIVGYVVMACAVFALLTAAWFAIGAEGAFQPNSWNVSGTWSATSIVVGLVAAYFGGWVCVKIGGSKAATWLIGLVLVLGVLAALPAVTAAPPTEPRASGLPMFEAMMKARTPAWVALLNPVVGAIGVWLASRGASSTPPRADVP